MRAAAAAVTACNAMLLVDAVLSVRSVLSVGSRTLLLASLVAFQLTEVSVDTMKCCLTAATVHCTFATSRRPANDFDSGETAGPRAAQRRGTLLPGGLRGLHGLPAAPHDFSPRLIPSQCPENISPPTPASGQRPAPWGPLGLASRYGRPSACSGLGPARLASPFGLDCGGGTTSEFQVRTPMIVIHRPGLATRRAEANLTRNLQVALAHDSSL